MRIRLLTWCKVIMAAASLILKKKQKTVCLAMHATPTFAGVTGGAGQKNAFI